MNTNEIPNLLDKQIAARRAETLKALGHPLRLRLVDLLATGACHVGELAEKLEQSSAIVSQQLKILRLSRLVEVQKRAGHSYYRLANRHLPRLLACLKSCDQETK